MDWSLKQTAAPSGSVVSVDEVKAQSRVELDAEDLLIERLIAAATQQIDGPYGIGVCMQTQTWELARDCFPLFFKLPLYPVQSVDSITYIDQAGAEQTLDSSVYRVDTHSNPARITLEWNQTWPTARLISNSVKVTFTAGYNNVPADLKHALILLVAHWYENREPVNVGNIVNSFPFAVESILDRYRVPGVA
jgi:uncharacterized phiE125 gp8 family phage protein